jgi:signal transduction histidine kinase/CheY-like chemotaxis protein/streptogramin lyase
VVWYGCGDSLCAFENGRAHEAGSLQGLPRERWYTIRNDVDGDLWVRSDRSLYRRTAGAARFERVPGLPESHNTYPTLAFDASGRLLVPTDQGLARQTARGWEIVSVDDGLNTNDISAVMQDREGSIWLGLLGSGLARWQGYEEWQGWTARDGLSRSSVWAIARDRSGRLWVGTQFGLNYAEESQGRLVWKRQPVAGAEMMRGIAAAGDGSLWIAADTAGLLHLDPRSGAVQRFGANEGIGAAVLHVMVDRGGFVWASTRQGLFRGAGRRFERVALPASDEEESFVFAAEDAAGAIWACGDHGLARFAGGQWTRLTTRDGLKANMTGQVAFDPDGSVWVGYRDALGLTRLMLSGSGGVLKAEHIEPSRDGLRSAKSIFLGFDARGWLWAGTDHGVDVFDHARWRHFGRADGLIWDDTNSHAFFADGEAVWVGASRGLSRFQPRRNALPGVPPPVVFTEVRFGDQETSPDEAGLIPWDRRSLKVRFAALTFIQEREVRFQYRLSSEERWQETTQRELNYPNLPAGADALEVRARNAQGVWSVSPARFEFRIATPWWLTWWFRTGAAVFLLLIGRYIWQRRTYRLQATRFALEQAVAERTRELRSEKARAEQEKLVVQRQKREIERLLAEAKQTSEMKSEFLANMSHEIRTPLNGVLGMTDLVLATHLQPEQREYLKTARQSAESLLTILNDILDFSKIEAGRLELNPVEFSLAHCLERTRKMFALPVQSKRLQYTTHVDEDVPDALVGDPDRLNQLLLNLVGNAVKFTHEGGVAVRVHRESSGDALLLHFAVQDTGIGIPAEKCGVIFDAFRQADGSTTRKYGGTGLGLAICSRLAQLMGGRIWVESELGCGSTFHFTAQFRAAEAHAETSRQLRKLGVAVAAQPLAAHLRILLAEDNAVNQRLTTRLLERRGHSVKVASTGRQALEMLEKDAFDLVLMDVQMPDMDGLQATAAIRAREHGAGRHTRIVALTAHTMKGDRERCLEAGMDGYLSKPVNADELIDAVEGIAAGSPVC